MLHNPNYVQFHVQNNAYLGLDYSSIIPIWVSDTPPENWRDYANFQIGDMVQVAGYLDHIAVKTHHAPNGQIIATSPTQVDTRPPLFVDATITYMQLTLATQRQAPPRYLINYEVRLPSGKKHMLLEMALLEDNPRPPSDLVLTLIRHMLGLI